VATKGVEMTRIIIGRRGGRKRAENLSPERRSEIARLAAQAMWDSLTPAQRSARRANQGGKSAMKKRRPAAA
jgi:hypothetical protein